jgi:16S rRNA (uracil1498-N3)-methyltransferase
MRSRADAAPAYLYVPDRLEIGATIELSADEGHYVARVCRARVGDSLSATDGAGKVAALELIEMGRRVRAIVRGVEQRPAPADITVWTGPPEGARGDWLVEKLAELGVRAWQPLECERGAWDAAHGRRDRWRRLAIAAMRQSRRAHLVEIRDPVPVSEAIRDLPQGTDRWLAAARGATGQRPSAGVPSVGAIGPASGFSDEESVALEAAAFRPISLSDARLRTETAALAWVFWAAST